MPGTAFQRLLIKVRRTNLDKTALAKSDYPEADSSQGTGEITHVSIAPRVTETASFPARPAVAGSSGLRLVDAAY